MALRNKLFLLLLSFTLPDAANLVGAALFRRLSLLSRGMQVNVVVFLLALHAK